MAQWDTTTRQRNWRGNLYQTDLTEITDKTVGIIGLGRIGRQVAKRLTGFDTRTIYYDIEDIPEDVRNEVRPSRFPSTSCWKPPTSSASTCP